MNDSLGRQSGGRRRLVALRGPVAGGAVVAVAVVSPGVLRGILLELLPCHNSLYLLLCDLKIKKKHINMFNENLFLSLIELR